MPNLVLEKGGQTFRFGLHEEKGVTQDKYVTVPFNGREYYARYGDDVTPLRIEINGRTHFIQYNAVAFTRYYWERRANDISSYSTTLFFPKGRYSITLDGYNKRSWNININDSGNRTVSIIFPGSTNNHRYTCSISGVFNDYVLAGNNMNRLTIERIGD